MLLLTLGFTGLGVQGLGLGDLVHALFCKMIQPWMTDLVRNLAMPFINVILGQLITTIGLCFLICYIKIMIHTYLRVILI